jgi:exonuclease VII large subunit
MKKFENDVIIETIGTQNKALKEYFRSLSLCGTIDKNDLEIIQQHLNENSLDLMHKIEDNIKNEEEKRKMHSNRISYHNKKDDKIFDLELELNNKKENIIRLEKDKEQLIQKMLKRKEKAYNEFCEELHKNE